MNFRKLAAPLVLLIGLLVFGSRMNLDFLGGKGKNTNNNTNKTQKNYAENEKLTYKGKDLVVTKHAACRMECRFIKGNEILEVLDQDYINTAKTRNDGDCPSFAYEGKSKSGKNLRIVVADCPKVAKLVTVIDLDTDFDCVCK